MAKGRTKKTERNPGEYISECPISRLKPYKKNPRINEHAIPAVIQSIETYGFNTPIIVDRNLRICAGHTRYKAALKMGLTTVPVLVRPNLKGDKFVGYNIADNQTGTIADFDMPELANIVFDLKENDIDIAPLGFNQKELNSLIESVQEPSKEIIADKIHKKKLAEIKSRHRKNHPERKRARQMLTNAIKIGYIKPEPCMLPDCGSNDNIEGHHPDYSKPLEVVWLCRAHHRAIDNGKLKVEFEYVGWKIIRPEGGV
jgi:hypothetical protein